MNCTRAVALALCAVLVLGCGARYRDTHAVPRSPRAVKVGRIYYETVKPGTGNAIAAGVCFGETATLLSHERIGEGQEVWRGITSFDELKSPEWQQFYKGFRDGEVRRVWEPREYRAGWLGVERTGTFASEIAVSGVAPCRGG